MLLPADSVTNLFLATLVCFAYLCWILNTQPLKDSMTPEEFMTPDRLLQMTNIQVCVMCHPAASV